MKPPIYRPLTIGFLRAPVLPARVFEGLDDSITDPNQLIDLVSRLAGVPADFIREAIRIASPELAEALRTPGPNTLASIRRYLIRMCTRPTPFGYFAGAAPFRWSTDSNETSVRITHASFTSEPSNHLKAAGSSADDDFTIFLAPSCRAIAGRLYCDKEDSDSLSTQSIKITDAVNLLLFALKSPISFNVLTNHIASHFAQPTQTTASFLRNLIDRGFLVTDRVNHILQVRNECAQKSEEEFSDSFKSALNSANPSPLDFLYTTEFRLKGCLDRSLAESATDLAEVLISINGTDESSVRFKKYQRDFLERYGSSRVVPLAEVIDSGTGLGLPSEQAFVSEPRERDQILVDLFAAALPHGNQVELTETQIEQLQSMNTDDDWPESLDILLQVRRTVKGELELQIGPNPGCIGAGRHASRFYRSDPHAVTELLEQAMNRSRQVWPCALHTELRFAPLKTRTLNVISGIHASDEEIADCPGGRATIHPREIGISLRAGRLQIIHIPSGREIRTYATHMVSPKLAPRHYRALIEFSHSPQRKIRRFDWGPFINSPILPELRYRNFILSPRQWNPHKYELRNAAGISSWREQWSAPNLLLAGSDDNRLLLDLSRASDRLELIRLARNGPPRLHLEAAPHPLSASWLCSPIGTHSAEIVVSLVRDQPALPLAETPHSLAPEFDLPSFPPGSPWLYFQLPCTSALEERVLLEVVRPLANAASALCDRWFFIRYLQPDRHIRLRLRALTDSLADLFQLTTAHLQKAFEQSIISGMRMETYTPEYERYGGHKLYGFAELLFEADSRSVLGLLDASTAWEPDDRILLAARLSDSLMDALHLPLDTRIRIAQSGREKTKFGGQKYRSLKHRIELTLQAPWVDGLVETEIVKRQQNLKDIFSGTPYESYLHMHLETVRDLLHMQCNRFFGADPVREQLHFELLARTYESLRARHLR